jgi:hypothetical protein
LAKAVEGVGNDAGGSGNAFDGGGELLGVAERDAFDREQIQGDGCGMSSTISLRRSAWDRRIVLHRRTWKQGITCIKNVLDRVFKGGQGREPERGGDPAFDGAADADILAFDPQQVVHELFAVLAGGGVVAVAVEIDGGAHRGDDAEPFFPQHFQAPPEIVLLPRRRSAYAHRRIIRRAFPVTNCLSVS